MERIIIDTDPGVDDAMAILMACKATDKLKLEALTVVDGNVSLDKVSKNALGILELCHMEHVPVYQGASHPLKSKQNYSDDFHGNNGMGDVEIKAKTVELQKEPAVDYLIRMAKENKGEITIVPIGPLTNIALAIQKDKDFANNVKRLVIMGGAESGGNVTPVAEFNFFHDPEAAKIVFEAGFHEIVMVGLDATRKVYMTPPLREMCYLIGTPESRFIYDITRVYTNRNWELNRIMGCQMCDPLAIGYLLDESMLTLKDAYVTIETEGVCTGSSIVYRKERYHDKEVNCKVAVDADPKKFFEVFFLEQFEGYDKEIKEMLEREYR